MPIGDYVRSLFSRSANGPYDKDKKDKPTTPNLANGGHTPGGKGALSVQAEAECPERTMTAAAPALWIKAVRSAVILISGLVPHEAFKGAMIAIGKIHGIPPFGLN